MPKPPSSPAAPVPGATRGGPARKKILLVEDEKITLTLMRKFLDEQGYDVVTTQDGGMAVSLALAEKPDLMLLDLGLDSNDPFGGSQFDGFMVLEWLHRMLREVNVPVIVVTGRTGPELKRRVLDAGAVAFFQKPADKAKILTAIRIALDGA